MSRIQRESGLDGHCCTGPSPAPAVDRASGPARGRGCLDPSRPWHSLFRLAPAPLGEWLLAKPSFPLSRGSPARSGNRLASPPALGGRFDRNRIPPGPDRPPLAGTDRCSPGGAAVRPFSSGYPVGPADPDVRALPAGRPGSVLLPVPVLDPFPGRLGVDRSGVSGRCRWNPSPGGHARRALSSRSRPGPVRTVPPGMPGRLCRPHPAATEVVLCRPARLARPPARLSPGVAGPRRCRRWGRRLRRPPAGLRSQPPGDGAVRDTGRVLPGSRCGPRLAGLPCGWSWGAWNGTIPSSWTPSVKGWLRQRDPACRGKEGRTRIDRLP